MGGFTNPVFGGNVLIRPAVRSPNYRAGIQGWSINKDGSAEFNDLTLRGEFLGANWVQNEQGLFFYNGTPAAGNLIGSWAPAAGTDPYGNSYDVGLTINSSAGKIYLSALDGVFQSIGSSGNLVTINDGQVTFKRPGASSTATIIQDLGPTHGSLFIESGEAASNDNSAQLGIITSAGAPTTGQQDTYPRTATSEPSGVFPAYHYVTGAVVKTTDLVANTSATWQIPAAAAYNANWAPGSSASSRYANMRYRLDAEDNLHICGAAHATAALAAGSYTLFSLTGAYVPKQLYSGAAIQVSSADAWKGAVRFNVDSTGSVNFNTSTAIAAGDGIYVNMVVPLGNIA